MKRATLGRKCGIASIAAALLFAGCNTGKQPQSVGLSASDARAVAKDAYIYGFPMVVSYQTMFKQAIDTTNKDYRGPFNAVHSSKSVATPDDKFVVTPNSDTPYSYLWMDLRSEPIVISMPKIEPNRYYTTQLVDLYTYNFAYLGTRAYGNDGGNFSSSVLDGMARLPREYRRSFTLRRNLLTGSSVHNSSIQPICPRSTGFRISTKPNR